MDTNEQIILDLKNKVGDHQALDFLSDWKGVPVVIQGHIQEIRDESIIFRVEPPDSICLAQDEQALILHDIFIIGIQGRILALDIKQGTVELGEFTYIDRGFGGREMVRIEPDAPIEATMFLGNASIPGSVVDISLNGFGILARAPEGDAFTKGQPITLKLRLFNQEIEIPGTLLDVFPQDDQFRLAMSFSQEATGNAVILRYIARRRAEIRQEIQAAYQNAMMSDA